MNVALDAAGVRSGGRGAVTWYAYLLLGYFSYIVSIQGNILPFLRDELALSYRDVSLHTSAIAAGIVIVGMFGERLIARLGRRHTLILATLGSAAAAILLTLASDVVVSIGACFLYGVIGTFIPVLANAILADVSGSRRDVAFAEANAMSCLFATTAPVITGFCVWMGWGWRMAVIAAVASGLIIIASFARTPIPESPHAGTAAAGAPLPFAFWCYFAVLGLGVAVEFSAILWAPTYLQQVIGLDPTWAAMGGSAFFAGMLVGRLGGAALFHLIPIARLFYAAAVTVFIGFLLYRLASEPVSAVTGLFVVGLGTALLFPLSLSFAIGVAGPAAERGATRIMLASGLAILIAPPLLGTIADQAGLATALFAMPAFMALAVVAFVIGRTAARRRA
jgi:fucose permease